MRLGELLLDDFGELGTAGQFAIPPDIDAECAERARDPLRRVAVFARVTDEELSSTVAISAESGARQWRARPRLRHPADARAAAATRGGNVQLPRVGELRAPHPRLPAEVRDQSIVRPHAPVFGQRDVDGA